MTERLSPKNHARSRTRPLRIGFVPLNDCAPIVMAHELGLFEKYDLVVKLSRDSVGRPFAIRSFTASWTRCML